MQKTKNILEKLDLKSWMWIIGIIFLALVTYSKIDLTDLTDFFKILIPILLGSSFILLGVFALTEIRKSIIDKYSRETKGILRDIEGMRERQKHEELKEQIKTDQEILNLRNSLKGIGRSSFQKSVIYSAVLFTITLFLTFVDIGSYIQISNLVIITFFFFSGLFYFSKIIKAIFFALTIMKLD